MRKMLTPMRANKTRQGPGRLLQIRRVKVLIVRNIQQYEAAFTVSNVPI